MASVARQAARMQKQIAKVLKKDGQSILRRRPGYTQDGTYFPPMEESYYGFMEEAHRNFAASFIDAGGLSLDSADDHSILFDCYADVKEGDIFEVNGFTWKCHRWIPRPLGEYLVAQRCIVKRQDEAD